MFYNSGIYRQSDVVISSKYAERVFIRHECTGDELWIYSTAQKNGLRAFGYNCADFGRDPRGSDSEREPRFFSVR